MKPQYTQSVQHKSGHLKIVELFPTIQGEGLFIGSPSTFVRTGMCNLTCPGCDTKWDSWVEQPIEEIVRQVKALAPRHIVITGGEPLMWRAELGHFVQMFERPEWHITIESNASIPIVNQALKARVDLWSFSPKVGSLGPDEMSSDQRAVCIENILQTQINNQVKYVLDPCEEKHVESVFDFQDRLDASPAGPCPDNVFFQPYDKGCEVNVYHRIQSFNPNDEYNRDLAALTKLVMQRSNSRFRVVPQLHKYITWR